MKHLKIFEDYNDGFNDFANVKVGHIIVYDNTYTGYLKYGKIIQNNHDYSPPVLEIINDDHMFDQIRSFHIKEVIGFGDKDETTKLTDKDLEIINIYKESKKYNM